jgi:hypothetical protein
METRQRVTRTVRAFVIAAAILGGGVQVLASQEERAHKVEGAWRTVVTITDCATGEAQFSFPSLSLFIKGGGLIESNGDQGGLGEWQHVGSRDYTSVYSFLEFNPDGSFAGNTNVWSNVRLSADGNTFTSTTTAEITDATGTVLIKACGTRSGTRL